MATKKKCGIDYEKSGGNVFADLGLPTPEQEQLKARLTLQIYRIIRARNLTQVQAGNIIGIAQPQISLLMRQPIRQFLRGAPDDLLDRTNNWPGAKTRRVLAALEWIGWRVKRQRDSHRLPTRPG